MTLPQGLAYFTSDDGLSLAYAQQGNGVPLLCLAGLTRNMDDFETVLNFSDRARIIRFDSRGRGRSEYDKNWHNYNVVKEMQDVLALLDHLAIEKVAILGTSRGGLIAKTLAVAHKERLLGVILNDIGPMIEPAGLAYIFSYLGKRPGIADFDEAARVLPERLGDKFKNVTTDQWHAYARRIWLEKPDGLDLRYDPHLRTSVLERSAQDSRVDLWPLFNAFEGIPLALIRGENSDILTLDTVTRMKKENPHMQFVEVADRGHVPFLDEPEAQSIIASFLEQIS